MMTYKMPSSPNRGITHVITCVLGRKPPRTFRGFSTSQICFSVWSIICLGINLGNFLHYGKYEESVGGRCWSFGFPLCAQGHPWYGSCLPLQPLHLHPCLHTSFTRTDILEVPKCRGLHLAWGLRFLSSSCLKGFLLPVSFAGSSARVWFLKVGPLQRSVHWALLFLHLLPVWLPLVLGLNISHKC